MRPVLTKAFADVRRHHLQTLVVFVIAALAITVGAMGGTLLVQTSSPYDHAFAELSGPHLVAVFDARKVTSSQVAATARLASVAAAAGPWVAAEVPFEKGGTHLTATAASVRSRRSLCWGAMTQAAISTACRSSAGAGCEGQAKLWSHDPSPLAGPFWLVIESPPSAL